MLKIVVCILLYDVIYSCSLVCLLVKLTDVKFNKVKLSFSTLRLRADFFYQGHLITAHLSKKNIFQLYWQWKCVVHKNQRFLRIYFLKTKKNKSIRIHLQQKILSKTVKHWASSSYNHLVLLLATRNWRIKANAVGFPPGRGGTCRRPVFSDAQEESALSPSHPPTDTQTQSVLACTM